MASRKVPLTLQEHTETAERLLEVQRAITHLADGRLRSALPATHRIHRLHATAARAIRELRYALEEQGYTDLADVDADPMRIYFPRDRQA